MTRVISRTSMRRGTGRSGGGGGAKVLWCHNDWGMEDVPNWLAGRLAAQNIFDGGTHGGYEDSFYRYLNAGLRGPVSTGAGWFLYELSRVYARVSGPAGGRIGAEGGRVGSAGGRLGSELPAALSIKA